MTYSFQIQYKQDTELTLSPQNLSLVHSYYRIYRLILFFPRTKISLIKCELGRF